KGAPRVDLSRSVVADAARRSLESVSPHLVEVRGWGEVWWTGDFDVAAARGHLDGSLPAERCMACRLDARNVAGHGSASNSLVDVPLFD
ncbi:replication initiation protein, partial [Bifidobacterium longum]|nr:replication initiation protein [Bifidobacterium longum]